MSTLAVDHEVRKLRLVAQIVDILLVTYNMRARYLKEYNSREDPLPGMEEIAKKWRIQAKALITALYNHECAFVRGVRMENHANLAALETYVEENLKQFKSMTMHHTKKLMKIMGQADGEHLKESLEFVKQGYTSDKQSIQVMRTLSKWAGL